MERSLTDAYLHREGQAQRLLDAARRAEYLDKARYYAALKALAQMPEFEVVLLHIFQSIFLLHAATTKYDFGEQRLLLRLLKETREAQLEEAKAAAALGGLG